MCLLAKFVSVAFLETDIFSCNSEDVKQKGDENFYWAWLITTALIIIIVVDFLGKTIIYLFFLSQILIFFIENVIGTCL